MSAAGGEAERHAGDGWGARCMQALHMEASQPSMVDPLACAGHVVAWGMAGAHAICAMRT
jgi:hypothetical protein